MPDIGVRELKTHASEIIRNVREHRIPYVVTHRGNPVGLLTPLPESNIRLMDNVEAASGNVWDELTELGQAIAQGWQSDKTSAEILAEMRR